MILAAVGLFVVSLGTSTQKAVLSVDTIKGMHKQSGDYRSINRWGTIEQTDITGVPLAEMLRWCGAREDSSVRLIASDGYFWPAVGTTIKTRSLARRNPYGLVPMIAYSIQGEALDPEPDGTGPLRYVAPQYGRDDVNKPSWVSNMRVIEVGPLPKGLKIPDPKKVPENELWVVGDLGGKMPVARFAAFILGATAVLALVAGLLFLRPKRKKDAGEGGEGGGRPLIASVLVLALAAALVSPMGLARRSEAASFTFSLDQLKAMPAFSGHYTFLKQLEPYTYYEDDYKGVSFDVLLKQSLNLAAGAGSIKVRSRDGYELSLTLDEAFRTFPNDLKAIIAYEKNGKALAGGSDGEGPLRLIVPQSKPGKHDQGSDPNTPKCARMICSVEVVPSGAAAPAPSSDGSLTVYGPVTQPPAQAPAAPAQQPAATSQKPSLEQQQQQAAVLTEASGQPAATFKPMVSSVLARGFEGSVGNFEMFWSGVLMSTMLPRSDRQMLTVMFRAIGRGL